jgi:hypothetical protein
MFFSPIRSKPCKRCNLEVNIREPECPHCRELTKVEAVYLKKAYKNKMVDLNSGLGAKFIYLTIFLGVIFFTLLLV